MLWDSRTILFRPLCHTTYMYYVQATLCWHVTICISGKWHQRHSGLWDIVVRQKCYPSGSSILAPGADYTLHKVDKDSLVNTWDSPITHSDSSTLGILYPVLSTRQKLMSVPANYSGGSCYSGSLVCVCVRVCVRPSLSPSPISSCYTFGYQPDFKVHSVQQQPGCLGWRTDPSTGSLSSSHATTVCIAHISPCSTHYTPSAHNPSIYHDPTLSSFLIS